MCFIVAEIQLDADKAIWAEIPTFIPRFLWLCPWTWLYQQPRKSTYAPKTQIYKLEIIALLL